MIHYLTYFRYVDRNRFRFWPLDNIYDYTDSRIFEYYEVYHYFTFEHFEVDDMLSFYDSMPIIFIYKARSKHISLNTFLCNCRHHNLSLHYLNCFQKERPYHLDAGRTNAK